MTTSAISRIMDGVRIQAPGAMEGAIRLEFFNALKDFLARSDAWKEDIIIPIQPNWPYYELPPFTQALVNRLLWLEGQPPASSTTQPAQSGTPQHGWLERAGTSAILKLGCPPSVAQTWCAHVALVVADPTDNEGLPSLPEWIVEKYHDYIQSGVLSRMAAHPGKPYSNDKIALLHGRRFSEGTALAKKEARQGHLADGQRWSFPQTFGTHSQRVWR